MEPEKEEKKVTKIRRGHRQKKEDIGMGINKVNRGKEKDKREEKRKVESEKEEKNKRRKPKEGKYKRRKIRKYA